MDCKGLTRGCLSRWVVEPPVFSGEGVHFLVFLRQGSRWNLVSGGGFPARDLGGGAAHLPPELRGFGGQQLGPGGPSPEPAGGAARMRGCAD